MPAFEIIGEIKNVQGIARGPSVRIRRFLDKIYGKARWRKMKGVALVRLADGSVCKAELHWYEAHGMGRKDFKIKRVIHHE